MSYTVEFTQNSAGLLWDGELLSKLTLPHFPRPEDKPMIIELLYHQAQWAAYVSILDEAEE